MSVAPVMDRAQTPTAAAEPAVAVLDAERLGPYRVEKLLGRGAMGEVYLAYDERLDRRVAIKRIRPKKTRREYRVRFEREARAVAALDHPSIVRLHDMLELPEGSCLVMEYVPGRSLATLAREGGLAMERILELGRQIAEGLAEAHGKGLVHRDLKPENVLVTPRGQAKILDFGLVRLALPTATSEDRLTLPGALVGTPDYLAPEQIGGEEDSRSDLFSFGTLLYEMASGELPFAGKSVLGTLRKIVTEEAPSLEAKRPDAPLEFCRLLAELHGKEPSQRPSAAQAAARLSEMLRAEPSGPATPSWPSAPASPARITLCLDDKAASSFAWPSEALTQALDSALATPPRRAALHLEVEPGPVVAGLARLAGPGQVLVTRGAFDALRRLSDDLPADLAWLAYGPYALEGHGQPIDVFEVGVLGRSPLSAPEGRGWLRVVGGETIPGWRPAAGLAIPRRGAWRLERFIGSGSTGETWLAQLRLDDRAELRVFKFCFERSRLEALQREITLLHVLKAELGDRADIAAILDWSFDEAPYYIESTYTENGNLYDWARSRGGLDRISLECRVELAAQAAEALAAAHSVGVLHKDIKPSNVLIFFEEASSEPRARLTDFGVGDLVDPGRHAEALGDLSLLAGGPPQALSSHPHYLAPELLEGKPATLQSDVFALGVLLYQLVLGDLSRVLAPGWEREIEDPLLVEDIALAVDGTPERRLRDAQELANRLRRLASRRLERESEIAEREAARRQRSEAHRARLELTRQRRRRNNALLTAAALLFFGLMLGVQSWRVAREAERAEIEAQTSQRVSEFLIELFDSPRPDLALGDDVTAREILDRGARRIEDELAREPALQARLMTVMGRVYHGLGLYGEARDLLETSLRLRRGMYGDGHPETVGALGHLGRTLAMVEQIPRSVELLQKALLMQRRLPFDPLAEIRILNDLAFSLAMTGDLADSEAHCLEALALAEPLGDRAETVRTLTGLSQVLVGQGDLERALDLSRDALSMSRRLFGNEHPRTATVLNNLTDLHLARGDLDQAEKVARQALELQKKVLGEDHLHLAWAYTSLGRVAEQKGDLEAAELNFRRSIDIFEAQARAGEPLLGRTYNSLAGILIDTGRPQEAERIARRVIERRRQAGIVEVNWRQAQTLGVLGEALLAQGRFEEAEVELLEAYEATERSAGASAPYLERLGRSLAALYEAWGRPEEARRFTAE